MFKLRSGKGFTLIELMIVIAIIGIIVAIAVPTLISTRITAQRGNAQGVLSTIRTGNAAFYSRNGFYGDFTQLAETNVATGAPYLDTRFVGGGTGPVTIAGVDYTIVTSNPNAAGPQAFTATATLPDGSTLSVNETGAIT